MLNRVHPHLAATAPELPRILLVNAAPLQSGSHLQLLQSIPTVVETVASCADMYTHRVQGYVLVILALHPRSSETAEAAHFVRHRWSTAKILLLESECPMIDDWLYDERVDPLFNPAAICDAAKRLLGEEQ